MKKRVLVTGTEGFIGTNLVSRLKKDNYEVYEVDIFHPSNPLDLLEGYTFRNIVEEFNPDIVIHLAAAVGRILCDDDLIKTIDKNATMSAIIAKVCGEKNIKLFYTSTSEIYGDFGDIEANEDTIPKLPHNLYGLSKRWGEEVCKLYVKDLCIVRPSMPYGPGVPPGRGRRAMDNMMWQAIHDMPIVTHKGAERSWCWIGDLVEAYMILLETDQQGAFNVGRDNDYRSMVEIAQRACDLAGKDYSLIEMVDAPSNQTVVKKLSTQKLMDLGWSPKVELDEGEKVLFEWIKKFDKNGNLFKELNA